jgi:hypothetical protein
MTSLYNLASGLAAVQSMTGRSEALQRSPAKHLLGLLATKSLKCLPWNKNAPNRPSDASCNFWNFVQAFQHDLPYGN